MCENRSVRRQILTLRRKTPAAAAAAPVRCTIIIWSAPNFMPVSFYFHQLEQTSTFLRRTATLDANCTKTLVTSTHLVNSCQLCQQEQKRQILRSILALSIFEFALFLCGRPACSSTACENRSLRRQIWPQYCCNIALQQIASLVNTGKLKSTLTNSKNVSTFSICSFLFGPLAAALRVRTGVWGAKSDHNITATNRNLGDFLLALDLHCKEYSCLQISHSQTHMFHLKSCWNNVVTKKIYLERRKSAMRSLRDQLSKLSMSNTSSRELHPWLT